MRTFTQLFLLSLLGLGTLSLQSCEREGPAERAGAQIDEAARNAGDAAREAGDNINDAARDAGNRIEDACEDVTNSNC
ncbi:MAG TPA: hypothetical protein VNR18_14715 [Hyphomicrobiales bacterium]|nr:hypothetical protein [Hyphomicrobiales bacterium]